MERKINQPSLLVLFILLTNVLVLISTADAAWDNLSSRAKIENGSGDDDIYKLDSPYLFKLQDGRTMLIYGRWLAGTRTFDSYLYYQISDNGVWTPSIKISNSEGGYDASITQDPNTGDIIVAYAKYVINPLYDSDPRYYGSASVFVTSISPTYVAEYDYCTGINYSWSIPHEVVSPDAIFINAYVPNIVALPNNGATKLLIVYAHGCEPGLCSNTTQNAVLKAVTSTDAGATWSSPSTTVYNAGPSYYASKPSCIVTGNTGTVLCSLFVRKIPQSGDIFSPGYLGDSGIFTIKSHNSLASWDTTAAVVSSISPSQHKWPFLLNDGKEVFLAYTTKNGGSSNNFVNRWARSSDGSAWEDMGIISDTTGTAAWPALARRSIPGSLTDGITAAWSDDSVERTDSGPVNIYVGNLHYVHLLSPRGGENWPIGQYKDITWNYSFMNTDAEIDITPDGYSQYRRWFSIAESVPTATGSYTWQVTGLPSATNIITVNDRDTIHDYSGYFTIPPMPIVTPSAGANGGISPSVPQTVYDGSTTSFTVTPNAGYYIASVTGCGGTLYGNTYTTNGVTTDCTVTASFAIITNTVTPSAGAHGGISPAVPQTVNYGSTTSFTVTPDPSYLIAAFRNSLKHNELHSPHTLKIPRMTW